MDQFDLAAIEDFLLAELSMLRRYRKYLEEEEPFGGTRRLHDYQAQLWRDHVLDMLRRLQDEKIGN